MSGKAAVVVALSSFRRELYGCLTARADELFELVEALLCTDGPVRTLVELALAPEHRRGHGSLYDGLNGGRIEVARLRSALSSLPLPRATDGRIVLAADVSPWLRPDFDTSADRSPARGKGMRSCQRFRDRHDKCGHQAVLTCAHTALSRGCV
ncbi:transposase [Nonomuraea sp. NPDC050540]|uniref:transposase n=1 Tax=Nonomuraea sp. NPDC050540 TaxID=3364367 RepID=UPI0037A90D3E